MSLLNIGKGGLTRKRINLCFSYMGGILCRTNLISNFAFALSINNLRILHNL